MSSLLSTVLCETTKTRPVRTVAKLDIANTTARRNRTSQLASSAASVDKPVISLVTVRNGNADKTGATMTAVLPAMLLGLAVPPRTSWTLSWLKWVEVAASPDRLSTTTMVRRTAITAAVEERSVK